MYLARPDQGTHKLFDKLFSLSFAPAMYDSMQDNGHHIISFSHWPKPLLPSIAIPGLPSLPDQLTLDEEEAYLAKVSHITE